MPIFPNERSTRSRSAHHCSERSGRSYGRCVPHFRNGRLGSHGLSVLTNRFPGGIPKHAVLVPNRNPTLRVLPGANNHWMESTRRLREPLTNPRSKCQGHPNQPPLKHLGERTRHLELCGPWHLETKQKATARSGRRSDNGKSAGARTIAPSTTIQRAGLQERLSDS